MPPIDYDALRAVIKATYQDPPPEADAHMRPGMVAFADAYAETGVAVIRCVEAQLHPSVIVHALVMGAVQGMINLMQHMPEDDAKQARGFAASIFVQSMRSDADFIQSPPADIPRKADA